MRYAVFCLLLVPFVGCTSQTTSQDSGEDVINHGDDNAQGSEVFDLAQDKTDKLITQVECRFESWFKYKNEQLLSHPQESAYVFASSHKAVDADGAPNAYHPDNIGLDYLANAGYPSKSWWPSVLVEDPENPTRAYRQKVGEFKGYFVSKTSLQNRYKKVTDPLRYVDARNIPYLVYPGSFYSKRGTGKLGDLGYAFNLSTGESSPFVVADVGPKNAELGEFSIALGEGLGGENVNPKNGAGLPPGKVVYVVFPYSSEKYPWPLSNEQIKKISESLLQSVGGRGSVLACENRL